MDVSFRASRSLLYNYNYNYNNSNNNNQSSFFNSRSFIGFLSYKPSSRFSHSHSWKINNPNNGIFRAFSASGDFSRKKPKKWSSPGSRGRGPKSLGTKRDQKKFEENQKPSSSAPEVDTVEPEVGPTSVGGKSVVSRVNGSDGDRTTAVDDVAPSSDNGAAVVVAEHLFREVGGSVGTEELDDDQSNSGFENYEKTEAKERSEVLGSEETMDLDVLFGDEKGSVEELISMDYRSSEGGDDDDVAESEVLGSITRVSETEAVESELTALGADTIDEEVEGLTRLGFESDPSVNERDVLESVESELTTPPGIVTSEDDTESDKNVTESDLELIVSEVVDGGEMEVEDSVSSESMGSTESVKSESEFSTPDVVASEDIETGDSSSSENIESDNIATENDAIESVESEPVISSEIIESDNTESENDVITSEIIDSDNTETENDVTEPLEPESATPDVVTGDENDPDETVPESDVSTDSLTTDIKQLEDSLQKLVLEKQAEEALRRMELEREALRKQAIAQLAEDNFMKGNRVFTYPVTVKPGEEIEVFFNRSLSPLCNEPDVVIMGAFNDWRWQQFGKKLEKTGLAGDWWSCRIHIPNEAYRVDYVFNNGKELYDNNNRLDYHVVVEGGMDVSDFEDFLLEEKRREVEAVAREEAEREREAEELRRREEEREASEADRVQARAEVEKRRETVNGLVEKAVKSLENVWFFEPGEFGGGGSVRLWYNRGSGPLCEAHEIWVQCGFNGWQNGLSIVAKLEKSQEVDSDWWYAQVKIPDEAVVLDWVFADGPPDQASQYDNNNYQDFHAIVPLSVPDEVYWIEEEHRIYQRLQDERRAQEEAKRIKAEKTARMKAETKERTLKAFLLSQRHIVYTEPVDIQAGKDVTVFYNPSNTVLNGKPEVWFRCSFNRWTHRKGPLPPMKMGPAENGSHLKTTVKVPADAYMMDFVFSEREDGGIFDNKNNMDYHIPVFGGVAKEPPMHIVHIAVEMAPIAKVGGLGDVVTSLSRAVQDLNHHVDIVLPKYDCINTNHVKDLHYQRSFPWGGVEIKVWSGKVEGLSVYFLEPLNGLFWTGCVYAGKNDGHRFGFFCHAALEFLFQSGFHPDIIHCHDWSSAPVAWLYKDHYRQCGLSKARVVFTIHNLEFGAGLIGKAMAYADKATTVSGTYSKEVAGNPAIAPHLYKFHGILNGIDPDIWDPYNDKFIPVSYTSENVSEGKQAAKATLQQRLSIKNADVPLVGIISRLTHQKGIHLIKHAIWRTIERGGQVVLLGSAPDPRIQQDFVDLSNQMHNLHSDRARLVLTYDEPLSHLIYAGADFILVPSIFEPCGLTQLVAMRYGAIPVVRKTGGLYDTVFDVDHDQERARAHGLEPNGFSFEGADQGGVDYALNRAISAWYDGKEWLNLLRKRVMEQDWSWNRPALEYLELYHSARKN